jgi:hypothetical protein
MYDDYSAFDPHDKPEFQEYLANRKYRQMAVLFLLSSPFITWGLVAAIAVAFIRIFGS